MGVFKNILILPSMISAMLLGATLLGATLLGAGAAAAGTAETLETQCHAQLKLTDSACSCIGERGEAELNPKQQALVIAAVMKDQAAMGQAREGMTVDEMTQAGQWMADTPAQCATTTQ